MRVTVRVATGHADVLRCQALIAETYNREYEVVFSDDRYDLDAKIEPWPHRYLMVLSAGELVATAGLYVRDTYVGRFGGVGPAEIAAILEEAGAVDHEPTRLREVTKLVVRPDHRGRRLGRFLVGVAHARAFCQIDAEVPHLLVFCARRSIAEGVHEGAGLRTRTIKPFPLYRVHELYRSEEDPMDSRLIIPARDIPARWYDLDLPGEYDVGELLGEGR